MSRNERLIASLGALATAFVLAGCVDYDNHLDTASIAAGDAVRANREIHAIDPWPANVNRKDGLGADSEKAEEILKEREASSDDGTAKKSE